MERLNDPHLSKAPAAFYFQRFKEGKWITQRRLGRGALIFSGLQSPLASPNLTP